MPSPNISNNTYAGHLLSPYAARVILDSRTFSGSPALATVMPNIQGTGVIRRVDRPVTFQDNTVAFNPVDEVSLDQVNITPIRMSAQAAFDRDYLYRSWEAEIIGQGINKISLPSELESAIVTVSAKRISIGMESLAWNGKLTKSPYVTYNFTGDFAGWIGEALALSPASQKNAAGSRGRLALTGIANTNAIVTVASTANLESGDTVTINSANGNQQYGGGTIVGQSFKIAVVSATEVRLYDPATNAAINFTGATAATAGSLHFINTYSVQEALAIAWANTPNSIRMAVVDAPNIYVSNDVMIAYKNAISRSMSLQAGFTNTRTDVWADRLTDTFNGVRMEVIPGQAAGVIMVAQPSNLVFGLSVLTDMDTIKVVDFRETQLRNDIGMRADFSATAKLVWPQDVSVVSTTVVPA